MRKHSQSDPSKTLQQPESPASTTPTAATTQKQSQSSSTAHATSSAPTIPKEKPAKEKPTKSILKGSQRHSIDSSTEKENCLNTPSLEQDSASDASKKVKISLLEYKGKGRQTETPGSQEVDPPVDVRQRALSPSRSNIQVTVTGDKKRTLLLEETDSIKPKEEDEKIHLKTKQDVAASDEIRIPPHGEEKLLTVQISSESDSRVVVDRSISPPIQQSLPHGDVNAFLRDQPNLVITIPRDDSDDPNDTLLKPIENTAKIAKHQSNGEVNSSIHQTDTSAQDVGKKLEMSLENSVTIALLELEDAIFNISADTISDIKTRPSYLGEHLSKLSPTSVSRRLQDIKYELDAFWSELRTLDLPESLQVTEAVPCDPRGLSLNRKAFQNGEVNRDDMTAHTINDIMMDITSKMMHCLESDTVPRKQHDKMTTCFSTHLPKLVKLTGVLSSPQNSPVNPYVHSDDVDVMISGIKHDIERKVDDLYYSVIDRSSPIKKVPKVSEMKELSLKPDISLIVQQLLTAARARSCKTQDTSSNLKVNFPPVEACHTEVPSTVDYNQNDSLNPEPSPKEQDTCVSSWKLLENSPPTPPKKSTEFQPSKVELRLSPDRSPVKHSLIKTKRKKVVPPSTPDSCKWGKFTMKLWGKRPKKPGRPERVKTSNTDSPEPLPDTAATKLSTDATSEDNQDAADTTKEAERSDTPTVTEKKLSSDDEKAVEDMCAKLLGEDDKEKEEPITGTGIPTLLNRSTSHTSSANKRSYPSTPTSSKESTHQPQTTWPTVQASSHNTGSNQQQAFNPVIARQNSTNQTYVYGHQAMTQQQPCVPSAQNAAGFMPHQNQNYQYNNGNQGCMPYPGYPQQPQGNSNMMAQQGQANQGFMQQAPFGPQQNPNCVQQQYNMGYGYSGNLMQPGMGQYSMGYGTQNNTGNNGGQQMFNMGGNNMGYGTSGPMTSNMGPGPTNMGPGPMNMGPHPASMGPGPNNMGPRPVNMGPGPTNMGPGQANVGSRPYLTGPGPTRQQPPVPGIDSEGIVNSNCGVYLSAGQYSNYMYNMNVYTCYSQLYYTNPFSYMSEEPNSTAVPTMANFDNNNLIETPVNAVGIVSQATPAVETKPNDYNIKTDDSKTVISVTKVDCRKHLGKEDKANVNLEPTTAKVEIENIDKTVSIMAAETSTECSVENLKVANRGSCPKDLDKTVETVGMVNTNTSLCSSLLKSLRGVPEVSQDHMIEQANVDGKCSCNNSAVEASSRNGSTKLGIPGEQMDDSVDDLTVLSMVCSPEEHTSAGDSSESVQDSQQDDEVSVASPPEGSISFLPHGVEQGVMTTFLNDDVKRNKPGLLSCDSDKPTSTSGVNDEGKNTNGVLSLSKPKADEGLPVDMTPMDSFTHLKRPDTNDSSPESCIVDGYCSSNVRIVSMSSCGTDRESSKVDAIMVTKLISSLGFSQKCKETTKLASPGGQREFCGDDSPSVNMVCSPEGQTLNTDDCNTSAFEDHKKDVKMIASPASSRKENGSNEMNDCLDDLSMVCSPEKQTATGDSCDSIQDTQQDGVLSVASPPDESISFLPYGVEHGVMTTFLADEAKRNKPRLLSCDSEQPTSTSGACEVGKNGNECLSSAKGREAKPWQGGMAPTARFTCLASPDVCSSKEITDTGDRKASIPKTKWSAYHHPRSGRINAMSTLGKEKWNAEKPLKVKYSRSLPVRKDKAGSRQKTKLTLAEVFAEVDSDSEESQSSAEESKKPKRFTGSKGQIQIVLNKRWDMSRQGLSNNLGWAIPSSVQKMTKSSRCATKSVSESVSKETLLPSQSAKERVCQTPVSEVKFNVVGSVEVSDKLVKQEVAVVPKQDLLCMRSPPKPSRYESEAESIKDLAFSNTKWENKMTSSSSPEPSSNFVKQADTRTLSGNTTSLGSLTASLSTAFSHHTAENCPKSKSREPSLNRLGPSITSPTTEAVQSAGICSSREPSIPSGYNMDQRIVKIVQKSEFAKPCSVGSHERYSVIPEDLNKAHLPSCPHEAMPVSARSLPTGSQDSTKEGRSLTAKQKHTTGSSYGCKSTPTHLLDEFSPLKDAASSSSLSNTKEGLMASERESAMLHEQVVRPKTSNATKNIHVFTESVASYFGEKIPADAIKSTGCLTKENKIKHFDASPETSPRASIQPSSSDLERIPFIFQEDTCGLVFDQEFSRAQETSLLRPLRKRKLVFESPCSRCHDKLMSPSRQTVCSDPGTTVGSSTSTAEPSRTLATPKHFQIYQIQGSPGDSCNTKVQEATGHQYSRSGEREMYDARTSTAGSSSYAPPSNRDSPQVSSRADLPEEKSLHLGCLEGESMKGDSEMGECREEPAVDKQEKASLDSEGGQGGDNLASVGIVVPDELLLMTCCPDDMKALCSRLLERSSTDGDKHWKLLLGSEVVVKMDQVRQCLPLYTQLGHQAYQVLRVLSSYHGLGVVQLLPCQNAYHGAMTAQNQIDYIQKLRLDLASAQQGQCVFLSDVNPEGADAILFRESNIDVYNMKTLLTRLAASTSNDQHQGKSLTQHGYTTTLVTEGSGQGRPASTIEYPLDVPATQARQLCKPRWE